MNTKLAPACALLVSLGVASTLAAQSSGTWLLRGNALLDNLPSTPTAALGFGVDGGLDVDDDGIPDLVLGAPLAQIGNTPRTGGVLVISGADGSLLYSISGTAVDDRFGSSVALIPDVDGDGLAEIVVGAPTDDPSRPVDEVFVTVHSGADGSELFRMTGFDALVPDSFEDDPVGQLAAGPWQLSANGFSYQVRDLAGEPGMPSDGARWLEVSADGSFAATPPSNPGGFGNPPVGANQLRQTFQVRPDMSRLELDVVFISGEGLSDFFDDFVSVDIAVGDTNFTALKLSVVGGDFPNASPLFGDAPATDLHTVSVELLQLFPDATLDTAFDLTVSVGNFDDGSVPSWAYIDRVELLPSALPLPPGTPALVTAGAFGAQVARLGDVTGDGVADIFVGSPDASETGFQPSGRANVFSGADGEFVLALSEGGALSGFGGSAAHAGDVDGDGRADVVVGQTGATGNTVSVFSGLDGALITQFSALGQGRGVGAGADLDGDGTLDVVAGGNGVVNVFSANDAGDTRWETILGGASFGDALDVVGDVNGDGFVDVAVGEPDAFIDSDADGLLPAAGRVTLLSGADGSELFSVAGAESFGRLGHVVRAAGDVNEDGYADILVGGPDAPDDLSASGSGLARLVFSGNPWFITLGDRVKEAVEDGDQHAYEFVVNEGTRVSAQVKSGKGSALVPKFRVVGPLPATNEVVSPAQSSAKSNLAKVNNVTLDEAGRYRLELFPESGSSGAYELKTKGKYAKGKSKPAGVTPAAGTLALVLGDKPTGEITAGGETVKATFFATAGTEIKIKAKRASKQELLAPFMVLRGPLPFDTEIVSAADSIVNNTEARIDKLVLPVGGQYVLELGGVAATFGAFKVTTKGKFPKGKNKVAAPPSIGVD